MKIYYSLVKPGVLFGNVLTAVAGFLFASAFVREFDLVLFFSLSIGITLVIASACVINNVLDRDIDRKMERTKMRATVTGAAGKTGSVMYGIILGVLGGMLLYVLTNPLTTVLAVFGWVVYVWLYGTWSKRMSWHGTLVGAVSGAVPILAGYTTVVGTIDSGAILVFLALFYWQMPEFYSIAIYRREEYRAAGVPVISVVKGVAFTKRQIFFYTIAFVVSTLLLTPLGYTGLVYFGVMAILGVYFIILAAKGLRTSMGNSDTWARKTFHFSLIILLAYCAMVSVGPLLP